ncbi:MAG: DUF262 domain-containing protein [Terracidiphilus sp.]
MKYVNREMKVDQIIGYFNQKKINLIPPFQRGTVWQLALRRKLIENMVQERPIPAVFLYKQESGGSQFEYNILDGKQRLESLILFVGDQRSDLMVENVQHFFLGKPARRHANFTIELYGKQVAFKELDNSLVRRFREYPIPTIEIDMDDEEACFPEIVNLFIDINQQGVKVSRFDVVKALGNDPLFKQVFALIARKKLRKKSSYYTFRNNSFVSVMRRLNIVSRLSDKNSQVDRMWERFTEIALFARSSQHRAPGSILRAFIVPERKKNKRLVETELAKLLLSFGFLADAYRVIPKLTETKFATDQPWFYTLITTLMSTDLIEKYERRELEKRIFMASKIIDGIVPVPKTLKKPVQEYLLAATKQTTNPDRRKKRQEVLVKVIEQAEI